MKKESLITISFLMLSVAPMLFITTARTQSHAIAPQSHSQDTSNQVKGVQGNWQGMLEAGGAKLRLGLDILKSPDGTLTGNLDSFDQGRWIYRLIALS